MQRAVERVLICRTFTPGERHLPLFDFKPDIDRRVVNGVVAKIQHALYPTAGDAVLPPDAKEF